MLIFVNVAADKNSKQVMSDMYDPANELIFNSSLTSLL